MKQEFVTLPREVVGQAIRSLERYCFDVVVTKEVHAALRTALEQPQDHVPDAGNMVPAGWKLVPVEPTRDMLDFAEKFAPKTPRAQYLAMLDAAPQPPTVKECLTVEQPQANQPAMTPIAQRKLDSLLAEGYTISGYSVYHEQKHQHGFVTGAGLVGWWKPEGVEYPQPRGERGPVAEITGMDEYGPMLLWHKHWAEFPIGTKLYTHPQNINCKSTQARLETLWGYVKEQPKREPLTDEKIDAIAESMPGGLEGFLKGWGWRRFARAVLENDHNIK